ncbi:MAG TPA: maleylpyruvate isomerase N-terminal domain-containing protein [Methylomirabilota bacterium]|nr:maleylpyruvate isomerase N-terminal domain-containing protein [Methylomirabilota bacterium]
MTLEATTDVVARIDEAWGELERAMAALSEHDLTGIRDRAGWAVKDHLIHLAAWEQALVAGLEGRPRHEALGIDEATLQGDDDTVNAAIFARHRDRPLGEVLAAMRATHAATRARLARAPLGPGPALTDVAGNTWEHYAAHLGWIRELVGGGGVVREGT